MSRLKTIPYHGEGKITLWFLLKKWTERVRIIGSSDPASLAGPIYALKRVDELMRMGPL